MKPLGPPDYHYVRAAQGWLELGNPHEALAELARVSPEHRQHPDVLEAGWHIHALAKQWEESMASASAMIQAHPDQPQGWIHLSYALHELKRTQEAYDQLRPVVELFPNEFVIPYNLACYLCQMGKTEEAKLWLAKASQIGDPTKVRKMAREDPDLSPLRNDLP
jgi:tetratricopeptide (TPR) repeat protein